MKFTAIAIASAALVGSAVSAVTFDYGCTTPVHHYNISVIVPDVNRAMNRWNNGRVVPNGYEEVYQGSILKLSCQANNDTPSDVYQRNCRNALGWLWITVTSRGSQWIDNGFVPESCWVHWVQNGTALVKW